MVLTQKHNLDEEEGVWTGCTTASTGSSSPPRQIHPSAKFDHRFGGDDTSISIDRTAPTVSRDEEHIPTVYPIGSIIKEETDKPATGNANTKRKATTYSPFRDWRVYAILIGVALVVGVSTGMAVRARDNNSATTAAAATGSNAASPSSPDETTENTADTASDTSISSIDIEYESEDEPTKDNNIDVDGYDNAETDLSTSDTATITESTADLATSAGTTISSNTVETTLSPPQDDGMNEADQEEAVAQVAAPMTPVDIDFEMQLTAANYNDIVLDTEFGETLVDETFAYLRLKAYALSSNVKSMAMKADYTWDCHTEPCSPDSNINAQFTFSAALEQDVPEEEAASVGNIIGDVFSDQNNLQEWAVKVAAAGIDITSATVMQDDSIVGTYVGSGYVPSMQSASTVAMKPTEGWAEGVKLIGRKESTELYVVDPISMECVSESVEGNINAKDLLDTTFSHFWESLSNEYSSFVGLRLRVHTSTHVHQQEGQVRSLRSLEGAITTATFTARMRTSGVSDVTLDNIRNVLHSSLSGEGLEQWMASAVEHRIDITAARLMNSS